MSDGFLSRIGSDKPEPRKPVGPVVPPSDAYAKAALEGEISHLSGLTQGSRNAELNKSALKLARLPIDREYLRDRLIDACQANGHLGDDGIHMVEGTINSAFDKADRDGPRMVPEREKPSPVVPIGKNVKVPEQVDGGLGNLLLSPSGLRDLPEPEPLIENVLDQGTTALLFGRFGSMKSFTALDWACCVASGKSWQGRATKRARVLYVVAEGISGFAPRVDAWETGWRTKIDDDSMRFYPRPINLLGRDVDALASEVESGGYGLVILDTLARCMVGGDENSAKDAGIVIDSMTHLVHATPGSRGVVLSLHHSGKGGGVRGSSAF